VQIVDYTTGNDHFYLVGGVSLIEVIMEVDLLIAGQRLMMRRLFFLLRSVIATHFNETIFVKKYFNFACVMCDFLWLWFWGRGLL
jgi:hypothetical protein